MKKLFASTALVALATLAVPAQATVVVDFSSTTGSAVSGPADDLRWTVTGSEAFQVTATAWTLSTWKQGNTTYNKIYNSDLGQWTNGGPGGLGVINDFENGSSPSHTIDNSSDTKNGITYKDTDFIVLQFNKAVNLSYLYLDADPYGDSDFTFAYGSPGSLPFADNQNYTGLATTFNGFTFVDKPQAGDAEVDGWRATGSNAMATTWIVSALFPTASSPDKYGDAFKLSAIKVTVPPAVPEPATWAMMIMGFGLVGGVMRRKKPGMNESLRFA